MNKFKLKIILTITSFLSIVSSPFTVFAQSPAGFSSVNVHPQPVIKYGNTSYHDSQGARDPWVVKDNGIYYLYYDCMESFYNPSFESNLGTNGWDAYKATISSINATWAHSGSRILKVETDGTINASTGTGKYYFNNAIGDESKYAAPAGIEVMPDTEYIASAYMTADPGVDMELRVSEYTNDPADFANILRINNQYVYKGSIVRGAGSTGWQKVFVKFKTNTQTRAIRISFLQPKAVRSESFWDSVQLEKVTSGQSQPTDFPANLDFNQKLEDTLGWRSCISTSSDGINFTKRGLLKIQGALGEWENINKPGWVGSSFMYANVFPYNGKWYSFYWKGGQPLRNISGLPKYEKMRVQFPGSDGLDENLKADNTNLTFRDRSGLAVADSPLGPFTRISQSAPPINQHDMSVCAKGVRSIADATGANWGCEYLTATGVPQQINGQWIEFVAGMTQRMPGVWAGTSGEGGEGGDPHYGITSGMATGPTPLGPWTLSANNPIYLPKPVLEGPIYYFDKGSNTHVLFHNTLGGHGWGVSAIWTKDINNWPKENFRDLFNKTQIPWGGGNNIGTRMINLPTVVEDGSGKLLVYFGVREGTQYDQNETDERGYMFHDIGLLNINLPLFPSSASQSPSATTPPASSPTGTPVVLVGYSVAENLADLPDDISSSRITRTSNPQINLTHNFPPSNTKTTHTLFVRFFYSNGRYIDTQRSVVYNPPVVPNNAPRVDGFYGGIACLGEAVNDETNFGFAQWRHSITPTLIQLSDDPTFANNVSSRTIMESDILHNEQCGGSASDPVSCIYLIPKNFTPSFNISADTTYYFRLGNQSGYGSLGTLSFNRCTEASATPIPTPIAGSTIAGPSSGSVTPLSFGQGARVSFNATSANADSILVQIIREDGNGRELGTIPSSQFGRPVTLTIPADYPTGPANIRFYARKSGLDQEQPSGQTAVEVVKATLVGYFIADSPSKLPADPFLAGAPSVNSNNVSFNYDLPDSSTKTTHTIFIRFYYSNGSYLDRQQSIVYNPSAGATVEPTTAPAGTSRSPGATIWEGETGMKSTITDDESLVIHFNRNTDVNLVNLRIDGVEEGGSTQAIVLLTGGGTQLTWPNTHARHTVGSHYVSIHPYFCPNLPSQDGCIGGSIDERRVDVTRTSPIGATASCDSSNRATLSWPAVSGATHYIIRINKDPGSEWAPEWTGSDFTTVTSGDRAFNSGNTNTVTVNLSAGSYLDWSASPAINGSDRNNLRISGSAFNCSGN